MASFQISLGALKRNARLLRELANEAEAHVVLALKAYSTYPSFKAVIPFLDGCCASGLWEAKLAHEFFGKHILTYSPAYPDEDIDELLSISHHLDFNSLGQWERFREKVRKHPRFLSGELACGLRINPEYSTGHTALYDPCIPGSRLGMTAAMLEGADLSGISGLHFHTLCEQDSDDLERTLSAVEDKFSHILLRPEITYLNCGGGHWITKPFYDRERLVRLLRYFKSTYNLDLWIEPGEAVAIHTGVLRTRVLDVFDSSGINVAILDSSTSAHTPDVLEMPYRPDVYLIDPLASPHPANSLHPTDSVKTSHEANAVYLDASTDITYPAVQRSDESYALAGEAGTTPHTYRLGAATCLAGDILGDFSFPRPLRPGDELILDDMAHYTLVKTSFFNGVRHPDIDLIDESGHLVTARSFSYNDFKSRLG